MNYNFWQGNKVKLRAVEPKDFNWSQDYDSEADRTTSGRIYPNLSLEKMKEKFEKNIVGFPQDDTFEWTIEDIAGNNVGSIITTMCDSRTGTFRYGINIYREFRRKGYAKEAIHLVLKYYFRELRYQKVNAIVYSFNKPSIGLHRALGFKQEGSIRRVIYTNGSYHDQIFFGMTIEEFNEIDEIKDIKL